ncbi:MAG: translesion error-prone DNA polymerase V autoproteolytic subunit [Rikenellaceae bacterium]|nr:translesion error-prone DNA polymerase V autoproteolytic subunit [Rikenellaceae bacterium]
MENRRKSLEIIIPDLPGIPMELPLAGSGVSAGFPSPAEDYVEMSLDLNRELVRNPASTFFARVRGVSMTGEGIGDGDLLVIDRAAEVRDGALAVCFIDGEFTLKRVRTDRTEGCLWLVPANPDYVPLRVTQENDFRIWGVVKHVIKSF